MLTEYEANVVTKERLRTAQQAAKQRIPDEHMSIAHIEKRMQHAHKLRSNHLRALLTRMHSSGRIRIALLVLCLLSAASFFYETGITVTLYPLH